MKLLRYPENIISYLDTFYYIFCGCGIASFIRIKTNKEIVYKSRGLDRENVGRIILLQSIFAFGQYKRYTRDESKASLDYASRAAQFVFLYVCITYSQLTFLFHNDFLVKATELDRIDRVFGQLRVYFSLKIHYIVALICHILIPVGPIIVMASNRPWSYKIADITAYSYWVAIRFVVLYIAIDYMILIKERFISINNYLDQIVSPTFPLKTRLYEERAINFSITKAISIHQGLTSHARLLNNHFSGNILAYLLSNFVQSIFAVFYYSRVEHLKDFDGNVRELTVVLVIQVAQVGILAYLAFETEKAAKDTLSILGLVSLNVKNDSIRKQVNSYLLQGRQNPVEFTVCNMFPLHLSVFQKHITIVSMFVLLLRQFNN